MAVMDDILEQAAKLKATERGELIRRLIAGLDGPPNAFSDKDADAFTAEIDARIRYAEAHPEARVSVEDSARRARAAVEAIRQARERGE